MTNYQKKKLSAAEVNDLCQKYDLTQLESAVLLRRGISCGEDIKFYIEKDLRFIHQPFSFNNMEDAVDRINQAIDEEEKVLIFGDKDVDGISSTAILYDYLKSRGLDVSWRLPVGEDAYGLSIKAVDDFANEYGSLIITVDCGISNNIEIAHANELGIDVIVTDHHNPPEKLPDAIVIIDPKLEDSGYPFKDISGAAVAYKLVSALRMSRMDDLYGQDFCLLNLTKEDSIITLECLKTRNLIQKDKISLSFDNYPVSIYETPLIDFLKSQIILVWNKEKQQKLLAELFGSAIDFQLVDMKPEVRKILPGIASKELNDLQKQSLIAKYSEKPLSETDVFFNIFITFTEKRKNQLFPNLQKDSDKDLQLVAIAAMADIMPMQNENRIFVKYALETINRGEIRPGLQELIARSNFSNKEITSTDISWTIVPVLNAAGRLGKSNLSLQLLISDNPKERSRLAEEVLYLNEMRKTYVQEGEILTLKQAEENFEKYHNNLCIVYDKKIFRGITGILAGNIMKKYKVPSMAISFTEDGKIAVGSMRSCRNLKSTDFLSAYGQGFFINFGGHDAAAGFSFESSKLDLFLKKTEEISEKLVLSDENNVVDIDAELPSKLLSPELLKLIDFFEPYGEANPKLLFQSKMLQIFDASICGKTERQHLKLTFNCENCKFPAMFWGEAERLDRDFSKGDRINVVYNLSKNYFNGNVTPQMILIEADTNLD